MIKLIFLISSFSQRDIKIEERNIPGAKILCISFNGMNLATLMDVRKSDFDVSSIIFADPGQTMPNEEEEALTPTSPFYTGLFNYRRCGGK